jgi:CO dehydrogenase maturation factor
VTATPRTRSEGERTGAVPALRVAFVGKGGAGKSTLAGVFARLLARQAGAVLLLDSDPMPGLALSLGAEPRESGIPADAVEEGPEGGPRYVLRADLTPERLVERYSSPAPDGVRLLQIGKSGGTRPDQRSLHAYQQLMDAIVGAGTAPRDGPDAAHGAPAPALAGWQVVGDLPGGTRQPFMGWGRFASTFLVVVEPTAKSVLAARRLAHLGTGWSHGRDFEVLAVASKVRHESDPAWIAEHTGLEIIGTVPWDEELAAAERAGLSPVDGARDSRAVTAIGTLVDDLRAREEAT